MDNNSLKCIHLLLKCKGNLKCNSLKCTSKYLSNRCNTNSQVWCNNHKSWFSNSSQ